MNDEARPAHQVDLEHPWVGLESFSDEARGYFFGRDAEVAELLQRLRLHSLLVLFGRSGLGKTSLLRARLVPKLEKLGDRPALYRIRYSEGEKFPLDQLLVALEVLGQLDVPGLALPEDPASRLWLHFHYRERKNRVSHLILDQFEEIFTIGADRPGADLEVRQALAILTQGAIPPPVEALLDKGEVFIKQFQLDVPPLPVLLSVRQDYFFALNRWRNDLPQICQNNFELRALHGRDAVDAVFKPGELRCHYRGEISEENKIDTGLPPIVTQEIAERIVRFVAKKSQDVPIGEIDADPPILSLLCRELNERRFTRPLGTPEKPAEQITFLREDKADIKTIITSFYERCLTGRPEAVRVFIEEEFVSSYSGARLQQDQQSIIKVFTDGCELPGAADGRRAAGYGDSDKAHGCLEALVDQRLLTSLGGGENPSYELIHDLLADVVEKSRLTREAVAQARQQRVARRKRWLTAAACVLLVILPLMTWAGYYFFIQEHRDYYREFNKRNGFPVGITQISESEARRLPVSFRLIHKGIEGGIAFDGWKFWKLRWKPVHRKPAFRVEAVNGLLELTTNHGVFPYLWKGESEFQGAQNYKLGEKGERLELKTVCQWEFVSTTNSEIIYERALDRAGRMVYGLIYSPSGSASPSTRFARYVGPDGYPQFQRGSVAEYVQIYYDTAGWEDRVMYYDGKGLPATGPDGAFGERRQHNESTGQLTCDLSLDADQHPMIDNDGNSGMQSKYDEKGYDIEETSVGPDLRPLPLKDGYVTRKYQYDSFGRLRRTTYHGVNGKPVRSKKDGYHGWEAEYDEQGNQTVETYIGLDGKPMRIADGYATVRMAYDARGNVIRQTFHGVNGEPVVSKKNGYHGGMIEYDKQGNQTVVTYIGLDGKPMLTADGYATLKSTHNARGKLTLMRFYGVHDERVLSKRDGYHGFTAEYDEQGNQTVVIYIGLDDKPMPTADGYATVRMGYDLRSKLTLMRFYGVQDEPILSKKDGYHGSEAQYDEQGNKTVVTYIGLDGKPMPIADGYATVRMAYDARGRLIRQTFHGVKGEPVRHKDGYYGRSREYDERGNQTVVIYIGKDGKPMPIADGYAIFKSTYDSRGYVIQQTFHGVDEEPMLSKKDGCYGWKLEYDDNGNNTVMTYIGLDGKPMPVADGYATMKSTYDARGNVVRQTFHSVNGEPILSKKNDNHGWEAEYDEEDNQTVETYLGLDGKPTPIADGYATVRMAYDARGNVIQQTFHGVNRERVLSKKGGYHGWKAEYDDHGNPTSWTFLGLDGKATPIADGWATVRWAYDARGKEIRQTFHGANGEPVLSKKDGHYGWEAEYDENGHQTVKTYIGLDGKPLVVPAH
jgi:eukaryotic-like serine/threonine-protein kinase